MEGNEIYIIINVGKDPNSEYTAKTVMLERWNDDKTKVVGLSGDMAQISITKFGGMSGFANEIGDVKYFKEYVLGNDQNAVDKWNKTSKNSSGMDDRKDPYMNDPEGAGQFSFRYDEKIMDKFKTYVKRNNLNVEDYNSYKDSLKKP